jgi:hypothetical protein
MAAFRFLADRRTDRDSHRQLGLLVFSQSSDPKVLTKQFEQWEEEAS